MPFGSGGCTKRNENSFLGPGSFATSWLRGFCSVAAAVGAEVKEGFDWECQPTLTELCVMCCQKEQLLCLCSAHVPNKLKSTWELWKLCCDSHQPPQAWLRTQLSASSAWSCSHRGAGGKWGSGRRMGYAKKKKAESEAQSLKW